MCGIAGFVLGQEQAEAPLRSRAAAMNGALAHRGPDGEGIWIDTATGAALAQRRLAIIDLSETGAQPMTSASGRHVMTYNGEIYNHRELRADLEREGALFRGSSDSEVLLEAWDRWGAERTLAALNGMFALAIWDRRDRRLTLARDRFGIKPLLWRLDGDGVVFASELKAMLRDPDCPRAIDHASLAAYLRHGAVPAPWTIIEGIAKLEPGSMLEWRHGEEPRIARWWSPIRTMLEGQGRPFDAPSDTLIDEAEALIGDAVERQMIADVPLGAFLSGGVDSSLVAALMQKRAGRPVETFTIGFEEPEWDEAPHAEAVAAHLGTRHRTLRTSGGEALRLASEIGSIYDEPFADSSQLPTLLLCRLVRQHVKVALSGDGGDETFAGYVRYGWGLRLNAYQRHVPGVLRRGAAALADSAPDAVLGHRMGRKLGRAVTAGASPGFVSGYRRFLTLTDPQALLKRSSEHHPFAYDENATIGIASPLARMQAIDATSYLPDDILVKVDRASMSAGLEVRVPLLDHRIWEWAAQLPDHARLTRLRGGPGSAHAGQGKAVLKAILARYMPAKLYERPKAGFAVPLARWLRGALKPWAEDLLSERALSGGPFRSDTVRALWLAHIAERQDNAQAIWAVLMFESWRRSVLDAA